MIQEERDYKHSHQTSNLHNNISLNSGISIKQQILSMRCCECVLQPELSVHQRSIREYCTVYLLTMPDNNAVMLQWLNAHKTYFFLLGMRTSQAFSAATRHRFSRSTHSESLITRSSSRPISTRYSTVRLSCNGAAIGETSKCIERRPSFGRVGLGSQRCAEHCARTLVSPNRAKSICQLV